MMWYISTNFARMMPTGAYPLTDHSATDITREQCHTCSEVPPVGVEPTLGTLLGGRPLPLGYGGFAIVPRDVQITLG